MYLIEVGRTSAGVLLVIGHVGRSLAETLASYISTGRWLGAKRKPFGTWLTSRCRTKCGTGSGRCPSSVLGSWDIHAAVSGKKIYSFLCLTLINLGTVLQFSDMNHPEFLTTHLTKKIEFFQILSHHYYHVPPQNKRYNNVLSNDFRKLKCIVTSTNAATFTFMKHCKPLLKLHLCD